MAALALYGNDGRALFLLCVPVISSGPDSRRSRELAPRRYEPAAAFTHSRGRWDEKPGLTLLSIGAFADSCLAALVLRLHAQQVGSLRPTPRSGRRQKNASRT